MYKPFILLSTCFSLAVMAGCGRTIGYSPASNRTYPAKPAGCPLDVLSTPPQQPYDELGTFDIDYGGSPDAIHSAGELREALGPTACRLGADGLIGFTYSGTTLYTRAVAFRWKEPATTVPAATTPATPPAPAPAATPPAP